ncbi:hypothetical protein TrVE_jg13880 [Triparma verrucosa]|uniref:Major facilitator superfamily (MFS) profile domain-containing protein n=1 Tax=Triparma verrucosa TaxID=1606542 RepID=A0A9W7BS63_9STRA|nr:hypothetical protein TrVE_jg13880 [Triparma verrucosa]
MRSNYASSADSEKSLLLSREQSKSISVDDPYSALAPSKQLQSLPRLMSTFSFCFANGCMLCSYFIITLPLESARISEDLKSLYLGCFIAIAGLTQLMCPLIGMLSDICSHRWGRRRPFMVLGGLFGCTFLSLQLYASVNELWSLYSFAFAMSMMSLNTIFSSMVGMVPDLIDESQVGAANGVQAVLSVTGGLFGFGFFYFVLDKQIPGLYVLYIFLVASTIVLTVLSAQETPIPIPYNGERRIFHSLPISEVKKSYYLTPSEHGDFFWVTLSRTFYYMGISAQTFFLYFLKDIIKMSDPAAGVSILSSVAQCSAALSAYPVGLFSDRLNRGRKMFIYGSCFILAIGNAAFLFCRNLTSVIVISGLIGMGNGGYLSMDSALAVDCLPNKEESAKYLGIWGVASFIGTALGPMIGGPLLYFAGQTDIPGNYSIEGYALLLSMSVVYFIIAALVLKKVKSD